MKKPVDGRNTGYPPGAKSVRMILLDVDGVLTDGGIVLGDRGMEFKRFDVQDGMGITLARNSGLRVGIITGRSSKSVARRARELRMGIVVQGAHDKLRGYEETQKIHNFDDAAVCYVGDDVLDIPLLRRVGFAVAVANARDEVKAVADYVTETRGGRGAVREIVEMILKSQGRWEETLLKSVPGYGASSEETE